MSLKLDMKEMERELYTVYNEDGLVDIVLGLLFLGWGIFLEVGPPFLTALLGPIALLIYYLGKRNIAIPRVGIIDPSPKMATRMRNLLLALLFIGLIALATAVLLAASVDTFTLADYSLAILGLIIAAGVSVLAYLLGASRIYAYALLLFIAFAAGEALSDRITAFDPFLTAVILAGALILLSGLLVLAQFLRKYPLPKEFTPAEKKGHE